MNVPQEIFAIIASFSEKEYINNLSLVCNNAYKGIRFYLTKSYLSSSQIRCLNHLIHNKEKVKRLAGPPG